MEALLIVSGIGVLAVAILLIRPFVNWVVSHARPRAVWRPDESGHHHHLYGDDHDHHPHHH